ncbi:MAG: 2-isopropylmalate synthase [Eubacteriales bacterium]
MARKIKIFDTTLRDGEQSPGCSMNLNEKLKIAKQLERLKVDTIEAGFAISSPGDFESVKAIAEVIKECSVASLCRAVKRDIDTAYEAVKGAANPVIHTFIATSDIHMQYKLQMKPDEVLERIREMVTYSKSLLPNVEFSAEDASRSDREFLKKAVEMAINCGATVVNIPDTVGYATPDEMYDIISYLKKNVENIDRVDVSVHCHNDLGMAVANSIAAIKAGASQIECTINGIGERAGNAALEEVVMAIQTRGQYLDAYTDIDTTQLYRSSNKLSRIIGVNIPPNKAIVGANAFAHEAGIHQHGVMKNRLTYEIMTPESIGLIKNSMILGKHSGSHAFKERLSELGYRLAQDEVDVAFEEFKKLCDKKKEVTDYDIEALVEHKSQTVKHYKLEKYIINSGNTLTSTANIVLNHDGEMVEKVSLGDGPVDAAYKAVEKIVQMKFKLMDYKIKSVSQGEDALGEVTVKVNYNGNTYIGRGLSTDILESSILALLHAVNKIISRQDANK